MIFGFIIELAVGLLCIVLGLLIWLKRKISLLHDYHYRHVKEEDISAYVRLMGIGLILIGAGICVTGFLNLLESSLWWVPLVIGLATGIIVMSIGQKRYNGSWMS